MVKAKLKNDTKEYRYNLYINGCFVKKVKTRDAKKIMQTGKYNKGDLIEIKDNFFVNLSECEV